MRVGEGERGRIEQATIERGVDFRCRHRRRHGAQERHGAPDTARRTHALPAPVLKLTRRGANTHELVLRQEVVEQELRVPTLHLCGHGRMLEIGVRHRLFHVEIRNRQERQVGSDQQRVLAGVIEGADLGHVEGADLKPVEILARGRDRLGVMDGDGELAVGTLGDLLGDHLDPLGEGARRAPGREIPGNAWTFNGLCLRGRRRSDLATECESHRKRDD